MVAAGFGIGWRPGLVGVYVMEPNPVFVNDLAFVGFGCRGFWSQNPSLGGEGSG